MRSFLAPLLLLCSCKIFLDDNWWDDDRPSEVSVVTVAPEQKGELGNRNFVWRCVDPREQTCLGVSGDAVPFPKRVALGARFSLLDDQNTQVAFAGTRFLRDFDTSFRADAAGTVALYAHAGVRVADFVHLRILAPTALSLAVDPLHSVSTSMRAGESQLLALVPLADNQALAGSLDAHWQVSDAAVLELNDPEVDAPAKTVHAKAAGTAVLSVSVGALAKTYSLTVTEAP